MKVIHSAITDGLSGTTGNSVLMKTRSTKFSYLRVWNQPARTEQNDFIGEVSKNMSRNVYQLPEESIEDLKKYAKKYKDIPYFGDRHKIRAGNWFAVWTLLLWNAAKNEGTTEDLNSATPKDILNPAGVGTVADAVNMGYLPRVEGYESLTNPLYTE